MQMYTSSSYQRNTQRMINTHEIAGKCQYFETVKKFETSNQQSFFEKKHVKTDCTCISMFCSHGSVYKFIY